MYSIILLMFESLLLDFSDICQKGNDSLHLIQIQFLTRMRRIELDRPACRYMSITDSRSPSALVLFTIASGHQGIQVFDRIAPRHLLCSQLFISVLFVVITDYCNWISVAFYNLYLYVVKCILHAEPASAVYIIYNRARHKSCLALCCYLCL